jgi:hypothetical protein
VHVPPVVVIQPTVHIKIKVKSRQCTIATEDVYRLLEMFDVRPFAIAPISHIDFQLVMKSRSVVLWLHGTSIHQLFDKIMRSGEAPAEIMLRCSFQ